MNKNIRNKIIFVGIFAILACVVILLIKYPEKESHEGHGNNSDHQEGHLHAHHSHDHDDEHNKPIDGAKKPFESPENPFNGPQELKKPLNEVHEEIPLKELGGPFIKPQQQKNSQEKPQGLQVETSFSYFDVGHDHDDEHKKPLGGPKQPQKPMDGPVKPFEDAIRPFDALQQRKRPINEHHEEIPLQELFIRPQQPKIPQENQMETSFSRFDHDEEHKKPLDVPNELQKPMDGPIKPIQNPQQLKQKYDTLNNLLSFMKQIEKHPHNPLQEFQKLHTDPAPFHYPDMKVFDQMNAHLKDIEKYKFPDPSSYHEDFFKGIKINPKVLEMIKPRPFRFSFRRGR